MKRKIPVFDILLVLFVSIILLIAVFSITTVFGLATMICALLVGVVLFIKIRRDKADVYKKNEELLGVRTYLQAILDSSSDIIITFDEDLRYTSINHAGEKYFGRSRAELIGQTPFEFYPQARNSERHDMMLKALRGERTQVESTGSLLKPDMRISTTYVPLVIEGKIRGVLNISKDITALEKANATILATNQLLEHKNTELMEANNSLLSFNYIASHDLKEPLRKIQTFSKLLLEEESDKLSPNSKYYFDRMISSAKRMQTLIEALLDYSKTNALDMDFVPVYLNVVMSELRKEYEEPIAARGGSMRIGDLPVVSGVKPLLSQLFSNLISNSIKYAKKDEPLKIEIFAEKVDEAYIQGKRIAKDFWKITVKDNGIGFGQQYAEKAFELFQRLHTGSKDYEGTGIGLTICRKLVQNHNGYIYAESEPGEGSVFTVLLPVPKGID